MNASTQQRRPDLYIIGASKSGSTSLYHYLGSHPDIYMSPDKEPDYFAPDLMAPEAGEAMRHGRDLQRYLALFAGATTERRLGEASVRYLLSRDAPRLIRDFQPHAYIVAMLRNPVDMVYSMHGQRLAEGQEDLADFADVLAAEADRREGRRIPAGSKNPRLATYLDRARFGALLPRWFEVFGRERVHVMIFEDFVREPRRHYEALLEFLDVDTTHVPATFDVHNASHEARSTILRAMLNARAPRGAIRRLLSQSTRDVLRRNVIRPVRQANRRSAQRPALTVELRRRLEKEFATDVAATSELLGRDLAGLWFEQAPVAPSVDSELAAS